MFPFRLEGRNPPVILASWRNTNVPTDATALATVKGSAINTSATVIALMQESTNPVHWNPNGDASTATARLSVYFPVYTAAAKSATTKVIATAANHGLSVLEIKA